MSIISKSFTIKYDGRTNMLLSECSVSKAFKPGIDKGSHPITESFKCLWDTGATGSVITQNVVDKLGLITTGFTQCHTSQGTDIVETHLVNIILPNHVGFSSLKVTVGKLNGFDVLIGMDIIHQGDLAISNKDGKTNFTFQVPSSHEFDFVKENNTIEQKPIVNPKKVGRNDPCPCGSGKKFKNCHGNNRS